MPQLERRSLGWLTASAGSASSRFLIDTTGRVPISALPATPDRSLPASVVPDAAVAGKSVLIWSQRQLPAALALLQLDGIARRIVLCPPDLAPEHLPGVLETAEVELVLSAGATPALPPDLPVFACPSEATAPGVANVATEWLLFTSGTSGAPKLVAHTLASLAGPLEDGVAVSPDAIWSTFYDIRRYGGLQILLRALLGGGTMILSEAGEPVAAFLERAGANGVTHISGTPSHWRRALMSGAAGAIAPRYVRLSGEVADQPILNQLGATFPQAEVAHAFASTEAGVAFDVRDGRAGFPASLIENPGRMAELKIEDGSLRIRSARTAARYLGAAPTLRGADGFVDTGDMVELRGDRYHFVGRREGVINVGGQKVHPEEVEAAINRHPRVRMARVYARPSPITGALVAAEVVLRDAFEGSSFEAVRDEILADCRAVLPAHKVPVSLRAVPSLDLTGAGKLRRRDA